MIVLTVQARFNASGLSANGLQCDEYTIALSALYAVYQLLVLNPQRGCSILSALREWEGSRCLADTWAANTPCWPSPGELGWEGCTDEEIVLSSCGLTLSSPRTPSPANPPPPAEKPKPPAPPPPPRTHQTQKGPRWQAQVLQIGQQLIVVGPHTPPWKGGGDEGEAVAAVAKAA